MSRLLVGARPGSTVLSGLLLAVLVCLAAAPLLFDGEGGLDTAARLCVMIVLAASVDLLLGHARIVSFAQTVFFGMGAYGVTLAGLHIGQGPDGLLAGVLVGAVSAAVLAIVIGVLALRAGPLFYAMMTFAVASVVMGLAPQLTPLTGGTDAVGMVVPHALTAAESWGTVPDFSLGPLAFDGLHIDGRIVAYYLIFGSSLLLFLLMLQLANSSCGRAQQAVNWNDPWPETAERPVLRHRIGISVVSAVVASFAGALHAIWVGRIGPDPTFGFDLMIGILVMVVIGGMGTMYGAVIGAVLLVLVQTYLRALSGDVPAIIADLPVLPDLLDPDRSLLWLGILLVLCTQVFPAGIVGWLRGPRG